MPLVRGNLVSSTENTQVRECTRVLIQTSGLTVDGIGREVLACKLCRAARVEGGYLRKQTRSAQGQEEGAGENPYHGLDSNIIEDVICVAIIDDGAHARVDDCLEVWERRTHPVTRRGKLGIHVDTGADPCILRANFGRDC